MSMVPLRSGRILAALPALICLVLSACAQNAPVTPPPGPLAGPMSPRPGASPDVPLPANPEPRSQPNPPPSEPAPTAPPEEVPPSAPLPTPESEVPPPASFPSDSVEATFPGSAAVSVPRWVLYGWYFEHLVYLDRMADQLGFVDQGRRRRVDLRRLGLSEPQAEALESVAYDCTPIVERLSAKFSATEETDSNARRPESELQLEQIAAEMIEAIETHLTALRPRLGDDVFARLDSYLKSLYGAGRLISSPGIGRPVPVAEVPSVPGSPGIVQVPRILPVEPPAPRWIVYGWYFQRVAHSDRLLRRRQLLGLGLTDEQAEILEMVASDCNSIVEELSAKFSATEKVNSKPRRPKDKAQRGRIAAAMIGAIETHVKGLRSRLGSEGFLRLDTLVHRLYGLVGGATMVTVVPARPNIPLPAPIVIANHEQDASAGLPMTVAPVPTPRVNPVPAPTAKPSPTPGTPGPEEDAATVTVLAVDPGSPSLLYAGTARGIYVTTSASDTWTFCRGPLANASISAVVVTSGEKPIVFASTEGSGVFKSADKGKTWMPVDSRLASRSVTALLFEDSGGGAGRVYAGTNEGVFRSNDLGERWEHTEISESAITAMGSLAGVVYAGTQSGKLFRTADRGATWSEEGIGPWTGPIRAIVSAHGSIYVAAENGLFERFGGGRAWSTADAGLPTLDLIALVASSDKALSLYTVTREGIWRSDHTGGTMVWTLISEISPSALAVAGSISYAGVRGTVLKSTDSGRSWTTTVLRRPVAP